MKPARTRFALPLGALIVGSALAFLPATAGRSAARAP